jgi:SNF2 family DNA or RNA helicase
LTQKILKTFIESEIGMNCEILNGTLSREMQNQVINYFDRDLVDVLIINPRVGGVGLNLVKANHVIHFTPEWNPAVTSQATDRAYRIGQNKKVFVYYFYSKFKNSNKKTVEEYFMKLLDRKKQIKNILLDNIAINKEFENIKNELLN